MLDAECIPTTTTPNSAETLPKTTAATCLVKADNEIIGTTATITKVATAALHVAPKATKELPAALGAPTNYCNRRFCITTDRMNELRRRAQDAVKQNRTFTIRGCFNSVRNALVARGWVEKLDLHRKHVPSGICQVTFEDLAQGLPKRKPGETRAQYVAKCERNIMSRFLEHMPIDFLWTNRKEKCDFIDQAKNPGMTINKFHRAPFTSKEGLCTQLKDFHWYYEEGTAEMYFPRCFNVWSPEELGEFVENFKLTACIGFVRWLVDKYRDGGFEAVFAPNGTIPFGAIDFAYKRCTEYVESCQHGDIDVEDAPRIWDHDWDAFLHQHCQLTNENARIIADQHTIVDSIIQAGAQMLENIQLYWPQYSLDGTQNLWIIKPANKCRGRGIQLMDNIKRILAVVNPAIASKSRYVVQKYIERPLIIHNTKFDIRQWFLITNTQPLIVWMYKESYLRFSSQEYSLHNHHESVHLTNHAIQKKYTNGKRDKRLPVENMWDCYSFQAYLRQIGMHKMWLERIYPGMRKAIVGTMLASQENMDRRPNTFELFGADFMITEDFHPWLIEINSSPDLGATTSVTARMCPQCLEDVVKIVVDRRIDAKADLGNFELIYRQVVPPTPAYMGLNLFVKGKQLLPKITQHGHSQHYQRRERSLNSSNIFKQRSATIPITVSHVHKAMPTFNATEYMEKCLGDALQSSRSSASGNASSLVYSLACEKPMKSVTAPTSPCPHLLKNQLVQVGLLRRSLTNLQHPTYSINNKINNRHNKFNEIATRTSLSATSKRHRSCGPRFSTVPSGNEKNFKFIINKCALRLDKVAALSNELPGDPPSDDLIHKANSKLNSYELSLEKLRKEANTNRKTLRSQSSYAASKRLHAVGLFGTTGLNSDRRRRVLTRELKSDTEIVETNGSNLQRTSPESAVVKMHAVGRGLCTLKAEKCHKGSHKTTNLRSINNAAAVSGHGFNITHRSNKFSDMATLARSNTRC